MKSVPKQSKINPFSTACHSDENSRCCVTFSICTNTAKNNNSIAVFTTTKCTNNNQPNSSKEPVHEREGRCSQLITKNSLFPRPELHNHKSDAQTINYKVKEENPLYPPMSTVSIQQMNWLQKKPLQNPKSNPVP